MFCILLLAWGVMGYFFNYFYRVTVLFPALDYFHDNPAGRNPWATGSYLTMNVMAGFGSMIVLFKYWMLKQKEFLQAENDKVKVELQLLKAQIHPHFLFNTLNNIYSFSIEQNAKTPQMLLQLSSLLSYVLYECQATEVLLSNELEVMNNYINLEKERYGNKLEISVNIEGDIENKLIAPLLLLPLLENAFKHGTSEQLEKPWLSLDVSVRQKQFRCKVVNSKSPGIVSSGKGIGLVNLQKRIQYIYPGAHEFKIADESDFFAVTLGVELKPAKQPMEAESKSRQPMLESITS
jgi:LytS/YehU family sensor histidine kinase